MANAEFHNMPCAIIDRIMDAIDVAEAYESANAILIAYQRCQDQLANGEVPELCQTRNLREYSAHFRKLETFCNRNKADANALIMPDAPKGWRFICLDDTTGELDIDRAE
jgi:hypothetical protein